VSLCDGLMVERGMCAARERRGEGSDYTTCPVCDEPISGSVDELNEHVEYCLNRVVSLVIGCHWLYLLCCQYCDCLKVVEI